MPNFKFFLFFFLIPFSLFAQKKLPDSLKTYREKAIYWNTLALNQIDLDSSIVYFNEAISYASQCDCDSILFSAHFYRSLHSYYSGKQEQGLHYCSILDSLSKNTKNDYFSCKASNVFAKIYSITDQNEKAIIHGKRAIELAQKIKDSILIAESHASLGYIYFSLSKPKHAIGYLKKSEVIYDKVIPRKNYMNYDLLIRCYDTKKEIDYYLGKMYAIVKDHKDPFFLTNYYTAKGDSYVHNNFDIREAKKACLIGLKRADSLNYPDLIRVNLSNLGAIELKLKNYKKAQKYLYRNLNEFSNFDNLRTRSIVLERLASSYVGLKDYKNAYEIEHELKIINDSFYTLNESEKFAEFDAKFKTVEKDKEIAKQHLQIAKDKNKRNNLIYGSIVLFLIAFASFQIIYNRQKRKKLATETQLQKEHEINDLRTKFLGNIAHEIRTPLALITGNLDLVKENYNNKEKALKNIDIALDNSKKVVKDANEILDLLKFEKDKTRIHLTKTNLHSFFKRLFLSFKSLADIKRIELDYQSSIPKDYVAKLDVDKIEKILNNLISNAIKYSPTNQKVVFESNLINAILEVKVTDFGQGIHFSEKDKIFKRFYQTSNSQSVGGIGIGLSLAKEFSEFLGGALNVDSEVDKGSTFTFSLPLGVIEEELKTQTDGIVKSDTQQYVKDADNTKDTVKKSPIHKKDRATNDSIKSAILIVEDNPEMSTYLTEILSDKYTCSVAFDGLEALEKLKNKSFDLITSDIMMPNLDGFQLREKINKNQKIKDIPFVLVSAKALTEDKLKGFKLGIDDYIVKPFNRKELLARINNLLVNKKKREQWYLANQNLLSQDSSSDEVLLDKIKAVVINNISNEEFKIKELASSVGYSQRQLTRLLKQHTGMSPVKFILEVRLQKAYQNLQNRTFFSLSEVRYDVGIISATYFNKKFKERFGLAASDLLSS